MAVVPEAYRWSLGPLGPLGSAPPGGLRDSKQAGISPRRAALCSFASPLHRTSVGALGGLAARPGHCLSPATHQPPLSDSIASAFPLTTDLARSWLPSLHTGPGPRGRYAPITPRAPEPLEPRRRPREALRVRVAGGRPLFLADERETHKRACPQRGPNDWVCVPPNNRPTWRRRRRRRRGRQAPAVHGT